MISRLVLKLVGMMKAALERLRAGPPERPYRPSREAIAIATVLLGILILFAYSNFTYAPDIGKPGGPIEGLTVAQLRKFYECREVFTHRFLPTEGLGPLYNGRSCYECHGAPGTIGGAGQSLKDSSVVLVAARSKHSRYFNDRLAECLSKLDDDDVNRFIYQGGPSILRRSATDEFPDRFPSGCKVDAGTIPAGAELVSARAAPALFGMGLIGAISDDDIDEAEFQQMDQDQSMAGRAIEHRGLRKRESRFGRFGWKCAKSSLLLFDSEEMSHQLGLTTPLDPSPRSARGFSEFPDCVVPHLPSEPNDLGDILARITYFVTLLAPPPRAEITPQAMRGQKVFDRLQCSFCHTPQMRTDKRTLVVDPDSPTKVLRFVPVAALLDKPVNAYSDFLLHDMGSALADGIPQMRARGGEWRTAPLWGLRFKKYYLHDGRTADLSEAVAAHGGQGQRSAALFGQLSPNEREDLLAFLRTL